MKEIRIDCAHQSEADLLLAKEQAQLLFRLNHTMPMTEEYDELLHRLFPDMGTVSVNHTDCPFMTGGHAYSTAITFFFIYLNHSSYHIISSPFNFYCNYIIINLIFMWL